MPNWHSCRINKIPWTPTKHTRICAHFSGGEKSNDPRKEAIIQQYSHGKKRIQMLVLVQQE